MKRKEGISLIVLIITIVVIVILTGAIVLNLINNNPIEMANKAAIRTRIQAQQELLSSYISNQFISSTGNFDANGLNVNFVQNPSLMRTIFTGLNDNELQKIDVFGGKLRYIGIDTREIAVAKTMNIDVIKSYDGTVEILKNTTDVINRTEGTVETWVYVTDVLRQDLTDKTIFSTYADEKYTNTLLLRYTRDKKWQGIMSSDYNQISDISVADTLVSGWHLFSLKWSASEFSLFIDGVKATTKVSPTLMQAVATDLHIGLGPRLNLVKNGYSNMGDNTNFTSFTYWNADYYSGSSSFKRTGGTTFATSEYIQVDPERPYNISGYFKSVGTSGLSSYIYYGLDCYDNEYKQIGQYGTYHSVNTETTLSQDLNPGDTVVYLSNASNWKHSADAGYLKYIGISNYMNYPDFAYTRNSYPFVDSNQTNNTITLSSAYAGIKVNAGTKVANYYADGGGYRYTGGSGTISTTSWINLKGNIQYANKYNTTSDNTFRYATKYVKILMLLNYGQDSTYSTLADDIEFKDVTSSLFNSNIKEICISSIARTDSDILNRYNAGILTKDSNVKYMLTD